MLLRNRLGQPAVFWSRQLWLMAGGFDCRYRLAAYYDLWLRFWRLQEPLFLDQELGVHRHHDGQATRVHAARVEREARAVSMRHSFLSREVLKARALAALRAAYGNGRPETPN